MHWPRPSGPAWPAGPDRPVVALLSRILSEAARRFGSRPALVSGPCIVTYEQLDHLGHEVASWLAGLAMARESPIESSSASVVAVMLPPCPEHHGLLVGAARAGWIVAGVNRRLTVDQRRAALEVVDPDMVVTTAELAVPGRWHQVLVEPAEDSDGVLAPCRSRDAAPLDPGSRGSDAADRVIVLTSGTTGTPKGAVFGDRQLDVIRRTDVGETWGGAGATLMATELVHIGAMTKLAGALQTGATTHLLGHWEAGAALELIERERVAVVGGIAAQVALMLRHPTMHDRNFEHVRLIVAGGGPADPALIREATQVFGAPIGVRYSATETGGLGCAITFDGSEPDDELETVGPPRRGFEVIVGDHPREPAAAGQSGRVWMHSPARMDRWWGNPAATSTTLEGDWVAMGDHGLLDDRGHLRLVGRTDDGWVRGGYNVHPLPIEHVLRAHPAIAEVAVVSRPDPVMGHVGVAVVVPAAGHANVAASLLIHAEQSLARHEVPVSVVEVESLPYTPLHKVDRRALRQQLREA